MWGQRDIAIAHWRSDEWYKISVIILNNYIMIIIYYLASKFPIMKYLNMYLSGLHNIISTDARNTSAQRVEHGSTGLYEHAPSIQYVNNSELRDNAAYETILYFTHHKNIKMQFGIMKENSCARLTVKVPGNTHNNIWVKLHQFLQKITFYFITFYLFTYQKVYANGWFGG